MKSKSIILSLAFMLVMLVSTSAQEENRQNPISKFTFGTEVGAIYGTPYTKPEKGAKGSPGLSPIFGIFARYKIIDRLSIQTGLSYSAKKGSYNTPATDRPYSTTIYITTPDGSQIPLIIGGGDDEVLFDGQVEGKFNNQYIENPILAIFNASDRWSVHGGVYTAYLIKGSHTGKATGLVNDFVPLEGHEFDEGYAIQKWDFGMNLGTNYKIYKQIEGELRLSYGLRSIFGPEYIAFENTVRNIYLQAKVNYTFQL